MASYCAMLREEQQPLPAGYSVEKAQECFHWACGRAYATPVGYDIPPFIVHPRGIALCHISEANEADLSFSSSSYSSPSSKSADRAAELLVVFRGTVFMMMNELSRNLLGCGIDPDQLFDDGDTTCLPGEARCHKMYIVRAFDALFTWLLVDVLDKRQWGQLRKVTVCGHSMGGAVAMLFAFLLKHVNKRLRALKEGDTMTIVGLADFMNQPHMRASPSFILERRGDYFFDHVRGQLLPFDSIVLHEDCEVSVYSFSSTQIGNFAFKRIYEEEVPNSYNHFMYWDPVTPLIFPWTFKPGWQLPVSLKKDRWKFFFNAFTGGTALHGPSHLLFCCFDAYFDNLGCDKRRLWKLLEPHVRVDPLLTEIGQGSAEWLTIPESLKDRIKVDEALQQELMRGGPSDITSSDISCAWCEPFLNANSTFVFNVLLVCVAVPASFLVGSILLALASVFVPLLLFPYVLYSFVVDRVFWTIGLAHYLSKLKRHKRERQRKGVVFKANLGQLSDVEDGRPLASMPAKPAKAVPSTRYVNALRAKHNYVPGR